MWARQKILICLYHSVHFEISVDVFDKDERGKETDGTKHQEEDITSQDGVAKELNALKETRHVGTFVIIKYGVYENENSSRPIN